MSELKAIVSCPANGVYLAVFYYRKPEGGTDRALPEISIPCKSYEHAQAVVNNFNKA